MKQSPLSGAEKHARLLAEQMGFEFVDIELAKEPAGRFLRLYIDKGGDISLSDLEAYHRSAQPLMEQVDYDYMEVSSPGADRPLKKPEDFERAAGAQVEVKLYRPIGGAKRATGALVGLVDGQVVVDADAGRLAFPLKDVALVKPLIEFSEEDLLDETDEIEERDDV